MRPEVRTYLSARHPGASIEPMAGDASTRTFFRVRDPSGGTVVVMDYGAPFREPTDDQRMTEIFLEAKLPVALVLDASPETGCLVLEDLGPQTLAQALAEPGASRRQLYLQAADLVLAVVLRGTPVLRSRVGDAGPALDAERFRFEMDFFFQHYLAGLCGLTADFDSIAEVLHPLAEVAAHADHPVLCHRDFHSRNLILRPGGTLALVDIQDARRGPEGYDLASLIFDPYADVSPDLGEELLQVYLERREDMPGRDDFRRRFHLVAAQRLLKALGTYGFQSVAKGAGRYREAIAPAVERLAQVLPQCGRIGEAVSARLGEFDFFTPPGFDQ